MYEYGYFPEIVTGKKIDKKTNSLNVQVYE